MDWTIRTVLRVFLVVGGLIYFGVGILDWSVLHVSLGILAIGLGAIGLWTEVTSADPGPVDDP